jgi:hypothetical protein
MQRLFQRRDVVVTRGIVCECPTAVGRVVATGCVAVKCLRTVGRVGAAQCVTKERFVASGRVIVAVVVLERLRTDGGVIVAEIVRTERQKTDGRVVAASHVWIVDPARGYVKNAETTADYPPSRSSYGGQAADVTNRDEAGSSAKPQ